VLERKAYLISASLGPVSDRSRRYLDEYLDAWATKGAPDHVWFEDIFPRMRGLKESFASLAGCDTDELAITTNISIAMSTIASALDYGERNKVVMSELDFPTDGHVWLAHAKRGVEIEWLRSPDGLTIPLEEYDRAIDERTAVVMVNRVLYRSSAIVDAKAVCVLARARGALSFVDDYHGTSVADPHRWLEDPDSDETKAWVAAQNKVAFDYLARIPERGAIESRLTQLWDYERYSLPVKKGGRYFYTRNDGLKNQSVLYVADSIQAQPRELLDPNQLSADGTIALAGWSVSDDGKRLARPRPRNLRGSTRELKAALKSRSYYQT
jgi:hypothetical protein